MSIKLFDAELKVMEVVWEHGDLPAKEIVEVLRKQIAWNKNTTYTVIKKCVEKGALERIEPNFICRARISKEEVQTFEVNELVNKLFDGSESLFFASLVDKKSVPADVLERLKKFVEGDNQ